MASTTSIVPAATPPPGQASNFLDPVTQEDAIIAVSAVFLALTLFVVGIRLYFSARITHTMGVEDYVCLAASMFSFADIGMIIDVRYMARHMWDIPLDWLSVFYFKRRFAQNIFMTFAFFTSRLAFLLLYLRLFGSNRKTRYAVYFGGLVVSLIYLTYLPLFPIFCPPKSWNIPGVAAKCQRLVPYSLVYGIGNIILDIYILLLPLPMIWRLQLPFEKKLGISVLFTTGVIVVIASVVGIVYRVRLTFGRDITWNQGAFDAISIVEINTAIICSSMPACASFFKYLSAKSTLFASVRATLGRSKPSGDSNANESRSRHKSQTWLTLKTPSASRHHLSSNSWQKIDPGKLGSCTQIASSAWPDPESNPEIRSEQPESEPVRYKADVANIDEESRANGIMKSITVNITSQKNQCER